MRINRCKCRKPRLRFDKYYFDQGRRISYRGTCKNCGLLRAWYEADNYKLIANVSNLKGGDSNK